MARNDAEDVIFYMADIIRENRYLRSEVERLKEIEKEYSEHLNESIRRGEESNALLLQVLIDQSMKKNKWIWNDKGSDVNDK